MKTKSLIGIATNLHTRVVMYVAYGVALVVSIYGQYHGMQRWMTGMEDMPQWLLIGITGAMIVLLDCAFLAFTSHMAHQRQQGERARFTIGAMTLTGSLSIGVSFFGHWSPEYSGRMQAVGFAGASLLGILLYLGITPLSEDPRRVKARNVHKALVAHFDEVQMEETLRNVILQTLDLEKVTALLCDRMDNEGYADRIASMMNPGVMGIPGYDEDVESSKASRAGAEVDVQPDTHDGDDEDDDSHDDLFALAESVAEVPEVPEAIAHTEDVIEGMVGEFADSLDDMIARIVAEGIDVSQKEIAERYGASQATVSRKLGKARKEKNN